MTEKKKTNIRKGVIILPAGSERQETMPLLKPSAPVLEYNPRPALSLEDYSDDTMTETGVQLSETANNIYPDLNVSNHSQEDGGVNSSPSKDQDDDIPQKVSLHLDLIKIEPIRNLLESDNRFKSFFDRFCRFQSLELAAKEHVIHVLAYNLITQYEQQQQIDDLSQKMSNLSKTMLDLSSSIKQLGEHTAQVRVLAGSIRDVTDMKASIDQLLRKSTLSGPAVITQQPQQATSIITSTYKSTSEKIEIPFDNFY